MEDSTTQTQDPKVFKASGSQYLPGQAATAALYVTKADRQSKMQKNPLDADNKLSSASAATSLKYASAQDLPSFPVVGISDPDSSAGAAASLANANQKPFEYWKPGYSGLANKSAHLAADYKMAPLWHPEASADGSKAASLAAKHGGDVQIWRPEATSEGNSAAGQAMRMKNLSPAVDYGYTEDGHRKALMAAAGAMSGRKRAGSTPTVTASYPDRANSATNALNAATVAHRPSTKSRAPPTDLPGLSEADATRIHDAAITNLGREMYTSHPPVAPEIEEKNRQAGIRAAAVSMAKQMYAAQEKARENVAASQAANSVHRRQSSFSSGSVEEPYQSQPQYAHLQEAAQKLAAERLAKLYDANAENAAYRNYYGTGAPAVPQSRMSIRGRLRRRASSDSELREVDEARSKQIRSQMSTFNDKLAQVDAKKRQSDRDALMAAAQRNVAKRMSNMDEKVFADTGKVSPAMMAEWEAKARARAEADSAVRMANHGKVNIGGGKLMDQSEVNAIAAARVQPTLDEISEKAALHRQQDEERRQEELERRRVAEELARAEKERDLKTKEEWRRFKEEEKREQREKKEQEKARKIEEKRVRDEEERQRKEEKRKSKSTPVGASIFLAKKTKEGKENPVEEPAPALDPLPAIAPRDTEEVVPAVEEESTPVSPMERTATSTEETVPVDTEGNEPVFDMNEYEPVTSENDIPEATDTIIPENVDKNTAEDIVARVFSAPVTTTSEEAQVPAFASSETAPTTEAEEINPNTTARTGASGEEERLSKYTTASEDSKPSTTDTTKQPPSATGEKEPLAERIAPDISPVPPQTTTSPPKKEQGGGVSSWLKNKLSRSGKNTKTSHESPKQTTPASSDAPASSSTPASASTTTPTISTAAPPGTQPEGSVREVAMAGKSDHAAVPRSRSTSISSLSSDEPTRRREDEPQAERGRTGGLHLSKESMAASGNDEHGLKPAGPRGEGSTPEEFEEAKDQFDAEKLPLPSFAGQRAAESPVRDSRFVEDL